MGPGLPQQDLRLSPDHCLFIDGKLIPASLVINDMTIVQELDCPSVMYYHVELDPHGVLLANGLPAESYIDTGNRAMFANTEVAMVLHPEFRVNNSLRAWRDDACAKLVTDAETLAPICRALAERARVLGYLPREVETDTDPQLQVLAGERSMRPSPGSITATSSCCRRTRSGWCCRHGQRARPTGCATSTTGGCSGSRSAASPSASRTK